MICIYHSRDLDGYCSGAIVKKRYPDAIMIGYDYGKPFPWDAIPDGEPVIMVDVSLPMADMERLGLLSKNLVWIDHHASAIHDYEIYSQQGEGFLTAVLKDGFAACENAWGYLYPNSEMPVAVRLLGKYDTWRNGDKNEWNDVILPFQFGMRLNVSSAEQFPQDLLAHIPYVNNELIPKILTRGHLILDYQRQQNSLAMKAAFEIQFAGYRVLACNGAGFNSEAFASRWDEAKHDLMMPFRYNGSQWIFSLYTSKEIDCSELAKSMGGGGHKKAAGFQMDHLPDFILRRLEA